MSKEKFSMVNLVEIQLPCYEVNCRNNHLYGENYPVLVPQWYTESDLGEWAIVVHGIYESPQV